MPVDAVWINVTVESGHAFFFFIWTTKKGIFGFGLWLNTTHRGRMLTNKICVKYAQGTVFCVDLECVVVCVWLTVLSSPTQRSLQGHRFLMGVNSSGFIPFLPPPYETIYGTFSRKLDKQEFYRHQPLY